VGIDEAVLIFLQFRNPVSDRCEQVNLHYRQFTEEESRRLVLDPPLALSFSAVILYSIAFNLHSGVKAF
jgi:hypothetical protein